MRDIDNPSTYRRKVAPGLAAILVCCLQISLLLGFAPSAEAKRIALVIGNGDYDRQTGWNPLHNPPADAAAVAEVLREQLQFDRVLEYHDLDLDGMVGALDRFEKALSGGDTAFFFYSGHGAQADDNYLIPTDAGDPGSARKLRKQSLSLQEVLTALRNRRTALNIVVLDACRDNPLAKQGKGHAVVGLRPVSTGDLSGETLIAYAAAPNRKARDGSGQLSPYTSALVKELGRPQHLWKLFGAVSRRVREATSDDQTPWMNTNFSDEYFLVSAPIPDPPAPMPDPPSHGQSFHDALRSGGEGPEMVVIPAGSFTMGSDSILVGSDAKPHRVTISRAFAMGKYEVTFDDYDRFCAATGRSRPKDEGWGRGRRPVINVSWDDASAYAEWLSQQTGGDYRLPSETEWEYAARARTTGLLWWGGNVGHNHANCKDCGSRWDNKSTAPVGSFSPNPFGLYDTAGNVWEWVFDWYDYDAYTSHAANDPVVRQGRFERVTRGGSWSSVVLSMLSPARGRKDHDRSTNNQGFRLARTL